MRDRQMSNDEGTTLIDEYIASQPEEVGWLLSDVREAIRDAAPSARETTAWRMPTFRQGENLIHFAAFKNHVGLYPGGEAVGVFAARLQGYRTSKGSIHLPLDGPVDRELIGDIVRWRVEQVQQRESSRRSR